MGLVHAAKAFGLDSTHRSQDDEVTCSGWWGGYSQLFSRHSALDLESRFTKCHLTYSLTMLLSSKGAKHEKHYTKMLRKIVKYDD
ncbi:MAG: hypothetical protein PUK70_09890 [Bacteroidales bacterium]|nr:hypothetical protein [Bacteroidales bacterium]MDY6000941.1 hypothetical protein [Candidatus Cryptobacteroides sp.]